MTDPRRLRWLFPGLGLLAMVFFAISLMLGPVHISYIDLLAGLFGWGNQPTILIAREIRLPRAVLAAAIGAGLGMSGAALQGLLRNPLADPGVVGISACAGLGAVIAFYSGWSMAVPLLLPFSAMAGAVLAVGLLLLLGGARSGTLGLILAGAGISSIAGALTALALNLAPSPFAVSELVFWLLGSLADRSLQHVWLAVPPICLGLVILGRSGRGLDALSLGEPVAESLGIDTRRLRRWIVLGTALAVGPGVAVAGAIGFVGLAVPHLLRGVIGPAPARLLWPSAIGGAALVLAADILVRSIPTGSELKLGVITSLVGAPLFLAMLLKLRSRDA